MVDVTELQNVPRNILGCASTSMSLSADHRPKASLRHLLYSTSMAKPGSIQTSTTKKSRTTSRSPSVIGVLWIEGASQLGTPAVFEDSDGKKHKGYDCITCRKPTLLHPSTKHGVQPYKGERHSIIVTRQRGTKESSTFAIDLATAIQVPSAARSVEVASSVGACVH